MQELAPSTSTGGGIFSIRDLAFGASGPGAASKLSAQISVLPASAEILPIQRLPFFFKFKSRESIDPSSMCLVAVRGLGKCFLDQC